MDIFQYRSRYRKSEMIIVDGMETVGTWNQPSYITERPESQFIQKFYVTNALEGRPDLIANIVYGSAELDWTIIAFNNPSEILNWPRAGEYIEFVDRTIVFGEL